MAQLDKTQESFSSTFFKKAEFGNEVKTMSELKLTKASGSPISANYLPSADSPLVSAGDASLPGNASYIGAFSGPNDKWMDSWANFDPQNTDY